MSEAVGVDNSVIVKFSVVVFTIPDYADDVVNRRVAKPKRSLAF